MLRNVRFPREINLLLMLAVGLGFGWGASRFWPHTPLHAVATHSNETCAIATGPLDNFVEAVYFLDYLSGDLRAAALNFRTGRFGSVYERNVMGDLDAGGTRNPQFSMVTGIADLQRSQRAIKPSRAVVYVLEARSGWLGAYSAPWVPGTQTAGRPIAGQIEILDRIRFRNLAIRE